MEANHTHLWPDQELLRRFPALFSISTIGPRRR